MKSMPLTIRISLLFIFLYITGTALAVDKKEPIKPIGKNESLQTTKAISNNVSVTKELTFKEKVRLIKEIRRELKHEKKNVAGETPKIILYVLAIIIPPVAVGIYTNWGIPTLWNLLFTLCFWLPGVVHAFYVLLR